MSGASAAAAMDYSDTGNVDFIPSKSEPPNRLVFSVGFDGPDQYQKQILVTLYNTVNAQGVLQGINASAESLISNFTHGLVHYCIVCFVATKTDPPVMIPILYSSVVTGKNPSVIHEYYGYTRDKRHGREFYRYLARAAGRSVGEILNTCFFSKIYEYLRFDDATRTLVPEKDPDNTTTAWLGIDYFGDLNRSFEETRRLQEVVDGAFIFPRCVYTMHSTQSSNNLLGQIFSPATGAAAATASPTVPCAMFNIIGVDKTTPLNFTPGMTFISGYMSRELDNFSSANVGVPKTIIQISNCYIANGLDGDNAADSALSLDHEVGGIMVRRPTNEPGHLLLDATPQSDPATTEPSSGGSGFFKLKDRPTPVCEAPLVYARTGKTDSRDLDYSIHTHPLACYRICNMGFGPPSGSDFESIVTVPDVDGGIVFSFDGEWMYYINPVLKYYMRSDPGLTSSVMRCNIPADWTTRSRSTGVELYKGGAFTPSYASLELRQAIVAYIASLAELTVQYHGLTIPMFHCQYFPRIPRRDLNVLFAVP
jgi:hypothetical protein